MKMSNKEIFEVIKGREDEKLIRLLLKFDFEEPGCDTIGWETNEGRILNVDSNIELHNEIEELIQSPDWMVSIEDIGSMGW